MLISNRVSQKSEYRRAASQVSPWSKQTKLGFLVVLCAVFAVALIACTGGRLRGTSDGWTPVVVEDGIVYVGTKQGEVKALEDGGFDSLRVKWTYCVTWKSAAQRDCETDLSGAYDSPVLGSDLLYVSGVDGYLYAIDKETGTIGEKGWRRPVGVDQEPQPLIGGPALATDATGRKMVLVGSEDGNLYAFDASPRSPGFGTTGGPADPLFWRFETGDKIWSTPLVANGLVYFGSHDKNVYALDLATGEEKWRFRTGGVIAGKPLLFNNLLVVGSFDKKLYGLNAINGTFRWAVEGDNWFWAGAVANERTIFAPSMDGNLYAVDGEGTLLWKHDMGSQIVSRPVLIPRGLVVVGKKGKLSLLDTNPNPIAFGREISSVFIGDSELKAPLFNVDDVVYVGSQGSELTRINMSNQRVVWCFDTDISGSAVEYGEIICN